MFAFVLWLALSPGVVTQLQAFQTLERQVMARRIDAQKARAALRQLVPALRRALLTLPAFRRPAPARWRFPVVGGRKRSHVGGRGSGFRPQRPKPAYSFYDGNAHGGHPTHDIFISDRDGDCKDDRSRRPVLVVAMTDSVVVSVNRQWKPGNPRGGIYLWAYEPRRDEFHYYAHLDRVDVQLGQLLKGGTVLGTVGKTGFRRRRPCHIHLMVLRFDNARMRPVNYYSRLP